MKVLYIGGTGEISYECVKASVSLGQDVTAIKEGVRIKVVKDSLSTWHSFPEARHGLLGNPLPSALRSNRPPVSEQGGTSRVFGLHLDKP